MSGYASKREVREVTEATLRMEGRDPADYNVAGIMRDAFYARNPGYGALDESAWRAAVERHAKREHGTPSAQAGPTAVCWEHQAGELPIRLSFSVLVF